MATTVTNNCLEYLSDEVMVITAIPVADISAASLTSAVNSLTPTIPAEGFEPPLEHAVTIGMQPASAGGILVPIMRMTGKAKDSEDNSVAGRLHTVIVSCDVDHRDAVVWEHLLTLERTASHLLLTFRNGAQAFVTATEDTYLCTTERDGAKTSVTFRIQNLMGIQMLV